MSATEIELTAAVALRPFMGSYLWVSRREDPRPDPNSVMEVVSKAGHEDLRTRKGKCNLQVEIIR